MRKNENKIMYFNNTDFDLIIKNSNILGAGLGLFLSINTNPILKDTFLGYYNGFWNTDMTKQSNCSYYINKRICIDVTLSNRPYTSIMNDAYRTEFKNNVVSKIAIDNKILANIRKKNCEEYDPNKIIELFTTQDILPGNELFLEYGESYWKSW